MPKQAKTSPSLFTNRAQHRRIVFLAAFGTSGMHLFFVGMLFLSAGGIDHQLYSDSQRTVSRWIQSTRSVNLLCGKQRCSYEERLIPRRDIDLGTWTDPIEVAVIPRLGLKDFNPHELPKLLKYEQPEKIQDGINIKKKPEEAKKLKNKENKPKPEERDKKSKSLEDLVKRPEDDDPRKRATRLEDLIGSDKGSEHGKGHQDVKSDPALAKLQLELQSQMTAPQLLPSKELRKLKTRVTLSIAKNGTILSFRIIRKSKNKHFDTAVRQALQRFMPKEGGTRKLPSIPPHILEAINAKKVKFVFDGALLQR